MVAKILIKLLNKQSPPPAGWINEMPEAFAAINANGDITHIGHKGKWYVPAKPTFSTRLHNWLVQIDSPEFADIIQKGA